MEQLFVYGTLMEPGVQERVFGRIVPGEPDRLTGYNKGNIRLGGRVYPIVRPSPGSSVTGLVLQLSQAELELADRYETSAYRRKKAWLASGRQVWVYQE